MGEDWSNYACCGYIIKAMEECDFSKEDIWRVLSAMHGVFDTVAVEEAAEYYQEW